MARWDLIKRADNFVPFYGWFSSVLFYAQILDFGLARHTDDEMTGYVATRWYRAPEIMLNWMHYNMTGCRLCVYFYWSTYNCINIQRVQCWGWCQPLELKMLLRKLIVSDTLSVWETNTAGVLIVADGLNYCICLYGVLQWTSGLWAASWPSFSLDGLCFLAPIVSFPPYILTPIKPACFQ